MIRINPDKMVRLELTPTEQTTILAYCHSLDRNIYNRIMDSHDGVLHLFIEDCDALKDSIIDEIEKIKEPKIQLILKKALQKLSPKPLTEIINSKINGHDFKSIDDLKNHLRGIIDKSNATPDHEMGRLSPEQVSSLIHLQWDNNNFPLKFNKELKLSDIKHSTFFANTTIFLKTLIEMEKEPTATVKGNLNREIVNILFDKLILDEEDKRLTLEYNKVMNEEDVFPLHIIKIVCEGAGLVIKRKNKILVVKKHQNLLSEDKAGELYNLLFNSYFRKFNIGYLDRFPELDCIQHTIAYSLFRLGEICKKYTDIKELPDEVFLPSVRNKIHNEISEYTRIERLLISRIINPLEGFGLLECNYKTIDQQSEIESVRKTDLFDIFIEIEVVA